MASFSNLIDLSTLRVISRYSRGQKGCLKLSKLEETTPCSFTCLTIQAQLPTISIEDRFLPITDRTSRKVSNQNYSCINLIIILLVLSDCISLSQSEDLCSIFTDEDTDSDDSEFDANISVSSRHSSYLLLDRLKKGQSKSQVRQKRPRALRKFEAPISRQLDPIRIRISNQSRGQQAILLVQQDNEIMDLGRTPIRLHERFQHLWSHRIVVFEEPRDEQLGIHH